MQATLTSVGGGGGRGEVTGKAGGEGKEEGRRRDETIRYETIRDVSHPGCAKF